MLSAGSTFALPPVPAILIEKIEGVVLEMPKGQPRYFDVIKLSVKSTTSPEEIKNLYSTIRRKTRYPIQDYKRPGRDEVLVILPPDSLPKGTKVGDTLRVLGYELRGNDESISPVSTRAGVKSIELNPKG